MATVRNFKGDKDIEYMIKLFRRECDSEGILSELKKRRYFEKPSKLRNNLRKSRDHKKKLDEKTAVLLELDLRDNTFSNPKEHSIPEEFSQGAFWFGKDCAKAVEEERILKWASE